MNTQSCIGMMPNISSKGLMIIITAVDDEASKRAGDDLCRLTENKLIEDKGK